MNYTPLDGFPYYFDLVKEELLTPLFTSLSTLTLLDTIDEEKASYRYQPQKWSIKQVLGHITDHERIKMSRAFLLSRKEQIELWGYDQEALVANSRFDDLTFQQLKNDFSNVRQSSISFIQALSDSQLNLVGNARQYEVTLYDFLKSIIGHERHHVNIIKEKYLDNL